MDDYKKAILKYYNTLESRFGYKYLVWKTKHFGYYPSGKADISEKKAQELMQDLIYKKLKFSKGDLILDAGCGYGAVAVYLANKYGAKIIGIDINPHEIKQAKEEGRGIVDFKVMDFSKTTFVNNTFNAIYTMETLSHAPNVKKALAEFYRILKAKGRFALFEYTFADDKQFSTYEMEMLNQGINGTAAFGLKQFRHDQFTKVLRDIGFINIKEQNITANFKPSLFRLRKFAFIPYKLIQLFGLQNRFVNTLIAVEWSRLVERGLWRYCIFTGEKP